MSKYSNPTHADVSVTSVSTQILAGNSDRSYLMLQNKGTVAVYLKLGGANANATDGVKIPPGGNWEPSKVPTTSIWAVSAGAMLSIIEGNAA